MSEILSALRAKFPAPAWAFFEELRNGTGFARVTTRSADAVAMSLWPSRGLELHGFEVKVSRADLKRELALPEKAEDIARFCDRWWLVTSEGVVQDIADIPPAWGWLVLVKARGKNSLKTMREASKLEAKPLDRLMVASILRNSAASSEAVVARVVEDRVKQATEEERARLTDKLESALKRSTMLVDRLRAVDAGLQTMMAEGHMPKPEEFERMRVALHLPERSERELEVFRTKLVSTASTLRHASAQARLALRSFGIRSRKGW